MTQLDLHDTQKLMDDVAAQVRLEDNSVFVALVAEPATTQLLLAVRQLPVPARQPEHTHELSLLLYREMHAFPIPIRTDGFRHTVVTVVVRRGFVVWSPVESIWALAWRYSNHNTDALERDIVVVTEHGWASLWSHAAGVLPSTAEPGSTGGPPRRVAG